MSKHYIKDIYSKKLVPIIEMWENYNGWYWFITEKESEAYEGIIGMRPDGTEITQWGVKAFGLVFGSYTEWGDIWMPDLELDKMTWIVPQINWGSNSRVVTLDDDVNPNNKEVKSKIEWKY
jgi:hypothetical protein